MTLTLSPHFLRLALRAVTLVAILLLLSLSRAPAADASQTDIAGPAGSGTFGENVVVLPNGNLVVVDTGFDAGVVTDVGAVYLYDGVTLALISTLTGSTAFDLVGNFGVTVLTNGNYVVRSPNWDNGGTVNVGAATWCSGMTGCTGAVSTANSLHGSTAFDNVGNQGVTALTNGNYVVRSWNWDNGGTTNVGAVTWCSGTMGCTGAVSTANSLHGATASDFVGMDGVTALTNGNYVVAIPTWKNGGMTNAGAVTWCSGTTGCAGAVTTANSLHGSTAFDAVGNQGVIALTNGNYVVASQSWDIPASTVDVGAATWCSGTTGCAGAVTTANSLHGATASDQISNSGVTALTNGNYVVASPVWDNPAGPISNARAVTFGNGTSGTVGAVTSTNSVVGTVGSGISTFSFDATRNRVFVGRGASSIVSVLFFNTTATADGDLSSAGTWDNGVPTALTNVTIPTGRTVTVNAPATIGSLNVAAGGTLTLNADLNVGGQLTLGAQINTGSSTLALTCSSTVAGASSTTYVIGAFKKEFCAPTNAFSYPTAANGGAATGTFTYPVGTANGYSPVDATATTGGLNTNRTNIFTVYGINPQSLTITANQTVPPPLSAGSSAARHWALTETGDVTADLTFHYLDGDVNGDESAYKLYRILSGVATQVPATLNTAANTLAATAISQFSNWGISTSAPTSATLTKFGVKAKTGKTGKQVVRVKWETGSELNVVGFKVWRRIGNTKAAKDTKTAKGWVQLNEELIAAQHAGEVVGGRYKYADKKVKQGKNYFYKLEIVLADGTSEWSEVVKVQVKE